MARLIKNIKDRIFSERYDELTIRSLRLSAQVLGLAFINTVRVDKFSASINSQKGKTEQSGSVLNYEFFGNANEHQGTLSAQRLCFILPYEAEARFTGKSAMERFQHYEAWKQLAINEFNAFDCDIAWNKEPKTDAEYQVNTDSLKVLMSYDLSCVHQILDENRLLIMELTSHFLKFNSLTKQDLMPYVERVTKPQYI